jgi:Helix-turn-helix domain
MMRSLHPKILKVLRIAKEVTNYTQLEQIIPFALLQETINQLLDAHDRSVELAQARKSARRWTPQERETLRRRWRDGASLRELANEFDRTPQTIEHQLVVAGELDRGAIRKAATLASPKPAPVLPAEVANIEEEEDEYYERLEGEAA